MSKNKEIQNLIKLTEPKLALEESISFDDPQAESLKNGILKLRARIGKLARELNRSIKSEDQLQEYFQDLIAFQELIRQLGPVRTIQSVLQIMLELAVEILGGMGGIVYLWGNRPLKWVRKKTFEVPADLEKDIEEELARKVIMDGTELEPVIIPYFPPCLHKEGTLILIPMASSDRQLGLFVTYIETSHLNYFGHHQNVFSMFGRAATNALENAFLFEKVRRLSIRDDLTDLYNARYMRAFLEKAIEHASADTPVTLFFMDLDHFKEVNDSHGHLVGSLVLTEVARLLLTFAGENDCACRYGGDEFVLALTQTDGIRAMEIAEKIRFAVEVNDFNRQGGMRLNLSMSIGVAVYPFHAANLEDLINYSDLAMYDAKSGGKNRVCVWSEAQKRA